MNREDINIFVILSLMADILQIANYDMNLREASNNAIAESLQRQNQEYLEIIKTDIKQLKEDINGKGIS